MPYFYKKFSLIKKIKTWALDIDSLALKFARRNVKKLKADVEIFKSNLFERVNRKFDIIVSNPPYISPNEKLEPEVIKANSISIFAEKNGLSCLEKIIKDARKYFRLHPMQVKRFLDELQARGFITCKNKHMKTGNEYQVTIWDDYQQLKSSVDILDSVLNKLKNKKPENAKSL